MATKIMDGGGPYFAVDRNRNAPAEVSETASPAKPKFANPVDQIRLEEAFAAAARVDDALQHAVARKFEDDGEYKGTNPFDLSLGEYMGVMMFAMLTAGVGIVIYNGLSAEKNAAQDNYRRRVEKHFNVMNSRLRDVVEKIPASEQKSLLQNFARQADFSFRMEKAALAATSSDSFTKGLSLVRSAESLRNGQAEKPSYAEAYLARTFPQAGYFENKLKDDLARLKMQIL